VCWVRIEGEVEAQRLSSGDIIVIPHGTRHILSDTPSRSPISLDEAFTQSSYDGQGVFQIGDGNPLHGTQLVCGHFEFAELFKHPLISHLPNNIIKHESDGIDFSWMKDTLKLLSHTATTQHDGSSAIIKRLSEVIFIQVVRFWSSQKNPGKGFIAALNDPHLSNGLRAFHENHAADWTVEKLARESSMSRSLFADRFKQYLDLSPMQYVTNWRMQNARKILIESNLSLDSVAQKVGYDSAAAFSKAFKRMFDCNPGEYRRLASQQA
jgi:AraC-like DNA-binding protein